MNKLCCFRAGYCRVFCLWSRSACGWAVVCGSADSRGCGWSSLNSGRCCCPASGRAHLNASVGPDEDSSTPADYTDTLITNNAVPVWLLRKFYYCETLQINVFLWECLIGKYTGLIKTHVLVMKHYFCHYHRQHISNAISSISVTSHC